MFILIDKDKGMTSHDVVESIRKITGIAKVGHGGTLDPNATGLLIVAIGRSSTKQLGELLKKNKTYEAEVVLGEVRSTDDVEGDVIRKTDLPVGINEEKITKILNSFLGENVQVPPDYSAIKVKGRKAYEIARSGQAVPLKPRRIVVSYINLSKVKLPIIKFEIQVSSGTYIRAIARDLGDMLGCGAYLNNLRRTSIGDFGIDAAHNISTLTQGNWEKYTFNAL